MADNDIIDFYKKADTDNKPEEPLKEQKETPEPVVSESVSTPVPESNDPFDKFLFNLAEKLKTEKKITEQQQQQFNERVVQPTTNPDDPFAKFLESFAGLVKEDENINKEENIKEATIDFINKLKNDDFFDRDVSKVIPKVKQAKSKSKKYLPPKFAKKVETVEEQSVIEQSTEPEPAQPQETNNPYLKELQSTEKKKSKIEDKISGLSDIKKIIAQQVQEQLSKYPNLGFTGGGGGTNAVQYAKGGTMDGDLNVTGKFLSGGVDISTLFSTGGGGIVSGIPDRLIAGSETLRLYSNGTIDFPNDTIRPPDGTILTLESENPLLSSYTRVALSPYAFFAYDNEGNSITFDEVDNAIVLTSKDQYEWTFNQQGVLVGPNGYLTVNALSSLGRILSGGKDLLEIFALSGQGGGGGIGRDDVNTIVISNSANWNTAYNVATAYRQVSGTFVNTTTLNSVSSLLLPTSIYQSASSNWQGTFTTVQSNSSNWNTAYNTATAYQSVSSSFATNTALNAASSVLLPTTIYQNASGNWQNSSTVFSNVSSRYDSTSTIVESNSGNWNSTYETVYALSASWEESADILPTTTNYLSTNNILLSAATVTTDLSAQGLIYSKSLTPNLPVPRITLMGANYKRGTTFVEYVTGDPNNGWGVGGLITLNNSPYLVVDDFTQEDLNNYQIFIEMVMYKKKKSYGAASIEPRLSFTVPCGNAEPPWGYYFWQRSGDLFVNSNIKNGVTRYNHLPITTLNATIPLSGCLNGHFRERNIDYLDPTSVNPFDKKYINCLVPFGSKKNINLNVNVNRMKFGYSRTYKPLYIAFRYICWLPNNNNGKGQIISGPLSKTIRVANLRFSFDTNHYQSSLKGFPVYDLNPDFEIYKTLFTCNFC